MGDQNEEIINEVKVLNFEPADWFLQRLVSAANSEIANFDITLSVGGILVSGDLIGGKKYFNEFADMIQSVGIGKPVADIFRSFEELYGTSDDEGENDDVQKTIPQYIHLRNAKYFHPSGTPIPTNMPILWRGRIS